MGKLKQFINEAKKDLKTIKSIDDLSDMKITKSIWGLIIVKRFISKLTKVNHIGKSPFTKVTQMPDKGNSP